MTTDVPENDGKKGRNEVPVHKISPKNSSNNSSNTRVEKPARSGGRRSVRDSFLRWLLTWPRATEAQEKAARCVWFDEMTDEERDDCAAYTPAYLRLTARPPAPAAFLRGRLWKAIATASRARAADLVHAPYCGKLWMAGFLWTLLQPPGRIHITGFDRQSVATGRETEAEMLCRKRAESGWPSAVRMVDAFGQKRKSLCNSALLPATEDFRQADWGGELFSAWLRLHARKCWPFPTKEPVDGFVWFPPVADPAAGDLDLQVEAALAAFETRVKEVLNGQDEG